MNLGNLLITNDLIIKANKSTYIFIPFHSILHGHLIISPIRKVLKFSQLTPIEIQQFQQDIHQFTDLLERVHQTNSSTVFIQNCTIQQPIQQIMVHIIPRQFQDLQPNDLIYNLIDQFPSKFHDGYSAFISERKHLSQKYIELQSLVQQIKSNIS